MAANVLMERCGRLKPKPCERRVQPVEIDHIDRRILTALHADARMSNSALAELVGIAPSTCHGRVRRLQELGVIRGFYTDIDPAAIGLSLQAMISVTLQSNARAKIRSFIQQIRRNPQVMDVYFLAGRPRHRRLNVPPPTTSSCTWPPATPRTCGPSWWRTSTPTPMSRAHRRR